MGGSTVFSKIKTKLRFANDFTVNISRFGSYKLCQNICIVLYPTKNC